jgi:hypothetical protein
MVQVRRFTGIRFERSTALIKLTAYLRTPQIKDYHAEWLDRLSQVFHDQNEIIDESLYGLNLTEIAESLEGNEAAFGLFIFHRYDQRIAELMQQVFIIGIDGECTSCFADNTLSDQGDYDDQGNLILKCSLCGHEQLNDKSEPYYI